MSLLDDLDDFFSSDYTALQPNSNPNKGAYDEEMEVNFKDVKLGSYERKSRRMIQLIDRLRDEGAHFDINLPTVVFCGNQSAGKSSLIEGISGIQLPRSDGTCTRCPMELRLSDSQEGFECSVSLQTKYDGDEALLPKPLEVVFQEKLIKLDDIELAVRRAQKAILNPKLPYLCYREYVFDDSSHESRQAEERSNEKRFTKNTVLIKIMGAKVNLTLVDLPGIIRSTESACDSDSILRIESLVKEYIENPEALIIAAISCKDEVENQAILSLAKEVDPDGLRTIGVLTKPDTIEADCHGPWVQVLNNERFSLKLGYYIVKNPTKKDLLLNITFEEARENEIAFFESTAPWSNALESSKSRFGVANLRTSLSNNLAELIERKIPFIKAKVSEMLEKARQELSKLPPLISRKPRHELLDLVRKFAEAFKAISLAQSRDKTHYHAIDNHFKDFARLLCEHAPILALDPEMRTAASDRLPDSQDIEKYVKWGPASGDNEFTLDMVTDILDRQKGREFSVFLRSEALHHILLQCQGTWLELALRCLASVESELKKIFSDTLPRFFDQFEHLSMLIRENTNNLFETILKETRTVINHVYEMEIDCPVSWEPDSLRSKASHTHMVLELALSQIISTITIPSERLGQDESFSYLCLTRKSPVSGTLENSQISLFENERKIMEIAQAYYSIAKTRYGDHIPMIILRYLIKGISDRLENHLIDSLLILEESEERLGELLQEDPKVTAQRQEILGRIDRLKIIKDLIIFEQVFYI